MIRNNYLDGSPRSLLRGTSLTCMLFVIITLTYYFSDRLHGRKFLSAILILISYIFACTLHTGIAHFHEKKITALDHMAIHGHIFATMLIIKYDNFLYYVIHVLFLMSAFIDCLNLAKNHIITNVNKQGFKYITSSSHYKHYAIGLVLALSNYVAYLMSDNFDLNETYFTSKLLNVMYLTYVASLSVYYFLITKENERQQSENENDTKTKQKIWSHYETYHLLIVIGTCCIMTYIFDFR
jgi:hypothetical protein